MTEFVNGGEFLTWVCDICIPKVPGAYWVREQAAGHRDAEMDHFRIPTPFRCIRCGWVE